MNCTNSLFISDASIDISILVIYFCIFRPYKGGINFTGNLLSRIVSVRCESNCVSSIRGQPICLAREFASIVVL